MFYRKHNRVLTETGTISMTKQSHKSECDINNILKQYSRTGIITHISQNKPLYTDLPSDLDYQTSLNQIIQAETAFNALPSRVRDSFNNDPETFLTAFHDPAQRGRLEELGLLPKKPDPEPFPDIRPKPPTKPAEADKGS